MQGTGAGSGHGVNCVGGPTGHGINALGGSSSGTGVNGTGGSTGGLGVSGTGTAAFSGVSGTGGPTGPGVTATAGGGGSPAAGALRFTSQAAPSAPTNGDMWFESTILKFRNGGVTYKVPNVLRNTLAWNPGSGSAISTGNFDTTTVTVTGAVAGADVLVTQPNVANTYHGWIITGYVTSANTVTLWCHNPSPSSQTYVTGGTFGILVVNP